MIKIWKGIEKEGIGKDSEILTLFVSSDIQIDVEKVMRILYKEPEIKSIYLGAGRIEFYGFKGDGYENLISYADSHNIKIVIETTPGDLMRKVQTYNGKNVLFVCSYYKFRTNIDNLYFKTDDFVTTRIFTCAKKVDITTVFDNRYLDDVLLYEEV